MARILPEYQAPVGEEQLREAVFQALGAASVSWDDEGVFLSERASQIGEELVGVIDQYAYTCVSEG